MEISSRFLLELNEIASNEIASNDPNTEEQIMEFQKKVLKTYIGKFPSDTIDDWIYINIGNINKKYKLYFCFNMDNLQQDLGFYIISKYGFEIIKNYQEKGGPENLPQGLNIKVSKREDGAYSLGIKLILNKKSYENQKNNDVDELSDFKLIRMFNELSTKYRDFYNPNYDKYDKDIYFMDLNYEQVVEKIKKKMGLSSETYEHEKMLDYVLKECKNSELKLDLQIPNPLGIDHTPNDTLKLYGSYFMISERELEKDVTRTTYSLEDDNGNKISGKILLNYALQLFKILKIKKIFLLLMNQFGRLAVV